ncbi:MAG: TonB-dependent receptor plug domain-containing protein [Chitinophagaceae bacterium]|jgi:hypothetical protein|nr:TonB-dependent receptor plug domain-containing protein [Chitinophagaceae bacterium]
MKKISVLVTSIFLSLLISAQAYKGNTPTTTPEEKLNELYCSGLFKTTDGTILDVASEVSAKGYLNILDWLQGRVAGLQVYTSRMGVSIPVIRGSVPGIYVDEMPVSMSYLQMLNINDIAIVKVIKTPFYGGFNGGGGAIAIYTLGGEEEEGEESGR